MEYLEKQNTDCLKGICAVAVVTHHVFNLTGMGSSIGLGPVLTALGYLAVSVFFALSGYGLAFSYNQNGGGYLSSFIRCRVMPIYVVYCAAILIYGALMFFAGINYSWGDFTKSFCFGGTIVPHGWYFQVIVLFYLIFYIAHKFSNRPLLFIFALTIGYIVACFFYGLSSIWYECALCFDLGFLFF